MMMILQILGSLGLFLFGMKVMSEGIQKASGTRLRQVMEKATANRFWGIFSGLCVTTVVQSSSATTVMIVSFVNAGVMKLREAIGPIMGANLGTTATFWIIYLFGYKFSLSTVCLPLIGFGFPLLFLKSARMRDIGEFLIGFGILFLGLGFLKDAVPDIRSNPEVLQFLQVWWDGGYSSVLLFILVGVLLTVAVQSSSAAGAITIALTVEGWIPVEAAFAVILGENIGTTITANIAALAGNYNAKCAARAHLLFNIIGVLWMLVVFYPFAEFIQAITYVEGADREAVAISMAAFHTIFNLLNICLLVGFVTQLEKLSQYLVRKSPATISPEGLTQGSSLLPFTGELNLAATERELKRLSSTTIEMFKGFQELLEYPNDDKSSLVKHLRKLEETSDELSRAITHHLVLCSSERISIDSASRVSALLIIAHELEEACDCCYRLVLQARRKYRKNRDFLLDTERDLIEFSKTLATLIQYCDDNLNTDVGAREMEVALDMERRIRTFRKRIRRESVNRMCDPESVRIEMICVTVSNEMKKLADHCVNIMQSLNRVGVER